MKADSCKDVVFEELIVSYIYDEATEAERRQLEGHILECTSCMDEFAGLSNARLSVFEWQREDFAHLTTPDIAYKSGTKLAEPSGESIFDRIAAVIGSFRGPALAFGSLVVLAGAVLVAIYAPNRHEPVVEKANADSPVQLAAERPDEPTSAKNAPVAIKPAQSAPASASLDSVSAVRNQARSVKAVARRRTAQPDYRTTAKSEKPLHVPYTSKKSPVLSDLEEADDQSLTLSDLFDDEVGSIR